MRVVEKGLVVLAAVALILLTAIPGYSQGTFGTIIGTAKDASGGVVPSATVRVTNQATGIERTLTTDQMGRYEATHLNPGTYRVTAEAAGFKKFEHRDVILEAQQTVRIDVALEVGSVGTEVTVTEGAPVVETEAPTISDVKTALQLRDLPMNTLNGVLLNAFLFTTPTGYQTAGSKFAMGGARGTQLYYNIDGISANSPAYGVQNSPAEPSVESIAEMKFNIVNIKAEFSEVTNVTAITKSGQNDLHGRLFEQNTFTALTARSFFAVSKGQNIINDFGASVGGPIKRNKTFFFGTYEGYRQRVPANLMPSVPTVKMRKGDFSDLLAAKTPTVVKDPLVNQPFPGNIIPQTRFSGASVKWQDRFFPMPNYGPPDLAVSNFRATYPQTIRQDQFDARVDHYISPNNTVYARFSYKRIRPHMIHSGVPPEIAGYTVNTRHGRLAAISDTWTISPTLINEFKVGFARGFNPREGEISGQEIIDMLGIEGLPKQPADLKNLPMVGISNFALIYQVAKGKPAENTFQVIDQMTWIKGAHTIKFGGEYRPQQANNYDYPSFGNYNFSNRFSGYSYADFLLGLPQSTSRWTPGPPGAARYWYLNGFLQDDYKITPNLTISYGLRYEYMRPVVHAFDAKGNFDLATGSLVIPNEKVRTQFVNPLFPKEIPIITAAQAGVPERSLFFSDSNNFLPRFGFAYRPFATTKTVVRGGYGLYQDDLGGDMFSLATGPFGITESFTNGITDGQPLLTFTRPFVGQGSLGTISVGAIDPHLRNPQVHQWNLTIEQALTGTTGLRISYIGTRALRLIYGKNLNQVPASTIPFSPSRRRYPLYQSVTWRENGGNQIFHALSTEVNRRFSGGLEFQAAWTWSKNLTDVDEASGRTEGGPTLENTYDRARERGDAMYCPRHRLVSSMIWQIPVGKGKRFMNRGGLADWLVGGWQLSAVYNAQTGEYFTPSFSGSDPSNTQTFGGTPDRIGNGNLPSSQRSIDKWFDASAFAVPPNGRFGNSGRNILIGPGRHAMNLGIFKTFKPTERVSLRLQATFTNALNHPNFGMPNGNISAPGSVGMIRSIQERDYAGPRQGLLAAFLTF